ncbi:MAG: O-methyltransferase [Chlamydiales bacterium]
MDKEEIQKIDAGFRRLVGRPIGREKQDADQIYIPAFVTGFEYLISSGDFPGDVLEFGTYAGYSAHILAEVIQKSGLNSHLWLYDSFEGLPASEYTNDTECYLNKKGDWVAGGMSLPRGFDKYIGASLANIMPRTSFSIVKGFFEDTMDKKLTDKKAVLVHLDCDLYSSSKYVLEKLIAKDVLQDGTLLYCDDYNCNRGNLSMGQRGALSAVFNEKCRFSVSDFLSYGWASKSFIIHDKEAVF